MPMGCFETLWGSSTPYICLRGNRENHRYPRQHTPTGISDREALLALEIDPRVGYHPPVPSGIKKPWTIVGWQARLVFVLWRRRANTRVLTYSLMLWPVKRAAKHVTPSPTQLAAASTMKSLTRNPPLGKFDRTTEYH
jgi:hypothetical protein